MNYVYLIREREFIRINEPVYKFGKTIQSPQKRMYGYPMHSEVLLCANVYNWHDVEKEIRAEFQKQFTKTIYGHEHFSGNPTKMVDTIMQIVNRYNAKPASRSITCVKDLYEMSDIDEIVISDKSTRTGLIRFKGCVEWFLINDQETLHGWLMHCVCAKIDKYAVLELDILNNCYKKTIAPEKKYHDIILTGTRKYNGTIYYYIDFLRKIIYPINKDALFVPSSNGAMFIKFWSDLNMELVNTIMKIYVNNATINEFKALCRSVFVKNKNVTFKDINTDGYSLSKWLERACCRFFDHDFCVDSTEKITKNTRVVFADGCTFKDVNVVVRSGRNINSYNSNAVVKYLKDRNIVVDIDVLFDRCDMLFNEVLWWSLSE